MAGAGRMVFLQASDLSVKSQKALRPRSVLRRQGLCFERPRRILRLRKLG